MESKTMRMGDREIEYVEIVTDYDQDVLRAAGWMPGKVQVVDLDGEPIYTSQEMAKAVHEAFELAEAARFDGVL